MKTALAPLLSTSGVDSIDDCLLPMVRAVVLKPFIADATVAKP